MSAMGIAGLARASLRHRPTAGAATFVAVLLGTVMIGSFATLVETAAGPVTDADAEALTIMGAVIGGWGALIVLFSVASTLGITIRARESEIGLLRTVGATSRQARCLVRLECAMLSIAAAACGVAIASVTGRLLLALLRGGGLVGDDVEYGGGPASLAVTVALVLGTVWLAAVLASRRATRAPATLVLRESAADTGRMGRWRVLAGIVLIGYGLVMAVITIAITADSEDPYHAMATAGSSSIIVGVGIALFSPVLLRMLSAPLAGLASGSVGTHLASYNTSRRSHLLAGVLAPVIVLTSAATGTLMAVGIDNRSLAAM